jgi:uncharacterized repeat protein (TIGR04138 family)
VDGSVNFWDAVAAIRLADGRYEEDAYAFVMDGLEFTIRTIGEKRHVSAAELLDGLCSCAKERFGLMAWTVLERWGVAQTGDVGEIVFQLIDAGVLSKTEEDERSDFDDLFDLRVVLEDQYFGFEEPSKGARGSA